MTDQSSILFIDALNLFSRHYVRNPAMSTNGHQAGGIVGFLNSVAYLAQLIRPKQIFVVWEGGGATRRRAIFKDYKANRRPPKLNRYYEDIPDTPDNRMHQIKFLVEVLKNVPVCQLFVNDCEADDVIGYLSRNKFRDRKKYIASSDRDYYQLLDEKTMVYSWTTKKFIGPDDVKKEFCISPENFVLAKAINGDASDGVPGVKGVGFKTLAKRFDMLNSTITLDELLDLSEKQRGPKKPKIYDDLCENSDLIKRNLKLMYLDVSNLAAVQVRQIESVVDSFAPKKNKMQLMRDLISEGLSTFDSHDFFSAFSSL